MHILLNLIKPEAVTMFVLALICLFGYCWPGYQARDSVIWLLWLMGGLFAIIAWVILVFSGKAQQWMPRKKGKSMCIANE